MISLHNVTKRYAGRTILDIPELSFEEGKRYALIGVNGSGKSTLLRLIAGTLKPDSGQIQGVPLADMGYMPQSPYAFSFSVRKNVEIALQKTSQPAKSALAALETVGLSALAEARGDKLSGGGNPAHGLRAHDRPTARAAIVG